MSFSVNQITLIGTVARFSRLWYRPAIPHAVPCRRVMVRTTGQELHDVDPRIGLVSWTNTVAVIVAGKVAEMTTLHEGAGVYVFGRLRHRSYERNGQQIPVSEIHAIRFHIREGSPQ